MGWDGPQQSSLALVGWVCRTNTSGRLTPRALPYSPYLSGCVDIETEELFNMFFGGNPFMGGGMYRAAGGGPPFARQRQHAHAHARGGGAQPSAAAPWVQLVQLAPLLLLLLFTFMSGRSAPAYSLQRTREYRTQLATATYEVPFWVRDAAAVAKDYPLGSRER